MRKLSLVLFRYSLRLKIHQPDTFVRAAQSLKPTITTFISAFDQDLTRALLTAF